MPSLHGLPLHIVCPLPPNSQRATVLNIEGVEWPAGGPQMQHRARDTPRLLLIYFVVLDIQACGRAILLTDCMDSDRIAKSFQVLCFHFGAECAFAKRIVEYRVRRTQEIFFRGINQDLSNNQPYISLLSSADVATPIWVIPVAKGGDRIKEEPAK